ncbi:hypothetical protein CERSUDRAFT_119893 [Gelatoporia subvermispora B]|uniref:BHLH domain-containing protein n=1 Tax=Ceriporiopsis subvermispora (strain B) TaxID=914234 RepID=M2QZF4_CERS8|nr:hypothetical protein CERSUDRAFT_119893 [Gelatoporia subvermispora B]
MPQLLTPAESVAFKTFLASVDVHDQEDWDELHPKISERIPQRQGKEALAKATKELMSLDGGPVATPKSRATSVAASSTTMASSTASSSLWPAHDAQANARPGSTYFFPSHTADESHSSHAFPSSHSQPQMRGQQAGQSSASAFALPPLAENAPAQRTATSMASSSSLPSLGPASASSSKRALPSEADAGLLNGSHKRQRPGSSSVLAQSPFAPNPAQQQHQDRTRRGSSSTPAAGPSKPALLSPSQKRANHIQSEQKRRANIRRGYEALCDAVPALREAIRQEDAAAASVADAKGGKARKRRAKGVEDDKPDGRAGPRSENVVLQKTIDHIRSLLTDRGALLARLNYARSTLARGHPALSVAPQHVDEHGVPLWDREWKGGTGTNEDGNEDGEGEGDADGSDEG